MVPSWFQIDCHTLIYQCPKQEGRGQEVSENFISFYQAGKSFPKAPTPTDRSPVSFPQPKLGHIFIPKRKIIKLCISGQRKQNYHAWFRPKGHKWSDSKPLVSNFQSQKPSQHISSALPNFLASSLLPYEYFSHHDTSRISSLYILIFPLKIYLSFP